MPDAGYFCIVTGHNPSGEVSVQSNDVLLLPGIPNSNVRPAVTGSITYPGTLTCTFGTWFGTPPFTYSYQWKRAPDTNIGTNSSSYTLNIGDANFSIFCVVTALNSVGSRFERSNTVGPINILPANVPAGPPTVEGTPQTGFSLHCASGSWVGTPTPVFTYQWKRDMAAIPGATSPTYLITEDDLDSFLSCTVTAANIAGSTSANSNSVGPVTGGTWTPASLPNLTAWYKSDVGVYHVADTTLAADGESVMQWKDQKGTAHMIPYTSAPPSYDAVSAYNNKPGIFFAAGFINRISTALDVVPHAGGGGLSIFAVFRPISFTANARIAVYLGNGKDPAIDPDYSDATSAAVLIYTGSSMTAYRLSATKSAGSITMGTNYHFVSVFDGTDHTLYINGTAQTPVASGGVFTGPGYLSLGDGDLGGTLLEIGFVQAALTPTELGQLETYLTGKWDS